MLYLEHPCMCLHADKRGSKIVRGRAVDTGPLAKRMPHCFFVMHYYF